MKVLQAIALVAVTWLAGECAYTVHELRPKAELTLEHINRATIAAGAAAANVERASRKWQEASQNQIAQSTAVLSETKQTLARIRLLVQDTDVSLTTLSSALTTAIDQQNQSLLQTQRGLQTAISGIGLTTSQASKVLADADAQITSPDIQKTLDNVATSSANLAQATQDGAATMKDVRVAVDKEVATLLAPVNKAKMAILFTAQLIGRLYGF